MFILFVLLFSAKFCLSISNASNCGCALSRSKILISTKPSPFHIKSNLKQCSIDDNVLLANDDNNNHKKMVFIRGGVYPVGTDDILIEADKEGPKRYVNLTDYYLDKYEVSNGDFDRFVTETGYKTEAEVFGDSFVFSLFLNSSFRESLKDFRVVQAPWWYKVSWANWRFPDGPDSNISDKMSHPVIHISWNDARKFCSWRGGRLPTEAEWEVACKGGNKDLLFPWGDKLFPDKTHMANIWQGSFPNHNSAKDGFVGTNPVDMFQQNELGLHNMAGNVWEWTEDGWDKNNPEEKVKKGGSYLCHKSYCYRYRCSARSHNTADSSAGNLGFRCAADPT